MRKLLEKTNAVPMWMRAPQWRWNVSLASRANPSESIAPLRSDDSLYEAASFYRHLCTQREAYNYRRKAFPEMTLAFSLWAGASPRSGLEDAAGKGGWRGLIDSLLLSGLPFDSFSSALRVDIPADSVRLYHDTFFDVRSYLDSAPAVFVNVFGAGEQPLPSAAGLEINCMLRLFAFTWGPDAVLEYFFSRGKGVNRMHARWLKGVANEMITREALSIAMDKRNFFKEDCREILELARKHWAMPEEEVSSVEEEMRRKFLHETVTLLDNQLRQADKLRAERDLTREQALAQVEL